MSIKIDEPKLIGIFSSIYYEKRAKMSKIKILSGNALKIIAALTMLIDHIGYMLFPRVIILRIIGRLAFPIFAFMIAEGCKHTRNKLRYFLTVGVFATAIQIVYGVVMRSWKMSVFVTFTLAIFLIYLFQFFKDCLFDSRCAWVKKVLSGVIFTLAVVAVYFLNRFVNIDYGFYGCMMPVAASLFHSPKGVSSSLLEKLDCIPVNVITMGVCLAWFSINRGWVQVYSLLALPLLMLYSGKRGKLKMKYFFYIFYPLHLVALEGIRLLLER